MLRWQDHLNIMLQKTIFESDAVRCYLKTCLSVHAFNLSGNFCLSGNTIWFQGGLGWAADIQMLSCSCCLRHDNWRDQSVGRCPWTHISWSGRLKCHISSLYFIKGLYPTVTSMRCITVQKTASWIIKQSLMLNLTQV